MIWLVQIRKFVFLNNIANSIPYEPMGFHKTALSCLTGPNLMVTAVCLSQSSLFVALPCFPPLPSPPSFSSSSATPDSYQKNLSSDCWKTHPNTVSWHGGKHSDFPYNGCTGQRCEERLGRVARVYLCVNKQDYHATTISMVFDNDLGICRVVNNKPL